MLKIDNREEIKQYLLKETENPDLTKQILTILEDQAYLNKIKDVGSNNKGLNFGVPGAICNYIGDIASIITVAEFSYKLWKINQAQINSNIHRFADYTNNNLTKEKIKEHIKGAMEKIRLKETNNDNE